MDRKITCYVAYTATYKKVIGILADNLFSLCRGISFYKI